MNIETGKNIILVMLVIMLIIQFVMLVWAIRDYIEENKN